MNNLTIRLETEKDYRAVEELTREAFWNVYKPGSDEHYFVHTMRSHPDFIPELAFVLAMIHLMLNDLSGPAGEVFRARLHLQGLILHLNGLIALALTWGAKKRQAAFLCVVRAILLDDLGIEHYSICGSSSALVKKSDNALTHTDHICRHTDTAFSVRHQRIQQVLRDLQIVFCCDL